MGFAHFSHVKISAISAVVPENCINIDDEIQYYDNDLKDLTAKELFDRNDLQRICFGIYTDWKCKGNYLSRYCGNKPGCDG